MAFLQKLYEYATSKAKEGQGDYFILERNDLSKKDSMRKKKLLIIGF